MEDIFIEDNTQRRCKNRGQQGDWHSANVQNERTAETQQNKIEDFHTFGELKNSYKMRVFDTCFCFSEIHIEVLLFQDFKKHNF